MGANKIIYADIFGYLLLIISLAIQETWSACQQHVSSFRCQSVCFDQLVEAISDTNTGRPNSTSIERRRSSKVRFLQRWEIRLRSCERREIEFGQSVVDERFLYFFKHVFFVDAVIALTLRKKRNHFFEARVGFI